MWISWDSTYKCYTLPRFYMLNVNLILNFSVKVRRYTVILWHEYVEKCKLGSCFKCMLTGNWIKLSGKVLGPLVSLFRFVEAIR